MRTKFAVEYIREHKGNRTNEIISAINNKFKSIEQFESRFEALCLDVAQALGLLVHFYTDSEQREVASFIERCIPI